MTSPHYQNYINELKKAKNKDKLSQTQIYKVLFMEQLEDANLADQFLPNRHQSKEIQFHPSRKWRFDFACEREKVAVELQGGGYGNVIKCDKCHLTVMRRLKSGLLRPIREGGRHQNPKALRDEYEKLNEAALLGWRVFLFAPEQIKDKTAINLISKLVSPGPLQQKDSALAIGPSG